jgi:hypothetical protein
LTGKLIDAANQYFVFCFPTLPSYLSRTQASGGKFVLDERGGTGAGAVVTARGTHSHSQLAREQGTASFFKLVLWAASTLCAEIINTLYNEVILASVM